MPLHVPVPAVVLEGDYSDYAIYDSFDDPDAHILGDWGQFAIINEKETEILIVEINAGGLKTYTIATKTLSALIFLNAKLGWCTGWESSVGKSAYGTYAVVNHNYDSIRIFKNGAIIKTLTFTDLGFDAAEIRTPSISPKGKYIVVSGKRSATGNAGWVVLVGS